MEPDTNYDKVYKVFLDKKTEIVDNDFFKGKIGNLLHRAILLEHLPFFEYLLERNADVICKYPSTGSSGLEVSFIFGYSLYKPCKIPYTLNSHAIMSLKMKVATDYRALARSGLCTGTLLHIAVIYKRIEIVKLLLEKGIDVNYRVRHKESIEDDSELLVLRVKLPHRKIFNCYESDEFACFPQLTALQMAILTRNYTYGENKEIIELLLENGATLDDETEQIHTLHLAVCVNADLFIIEKLIEYGANIKSVCKKQCTPLSHAVSNVKDKSIIFYLLKKGAIFNLNTINSTFHDFLSNHDIFCEQLFAHIVDLGADINSKNKKGHTPLEVHTFQIPSSVPYFENKLRLLLDYGAEINVRNKDGNTPLHWAVNRRIAKGVQILLEYEADHTLLNANGETPLTILDRRRIRHIIMPNFYISYFLDKYSPSEIIACFIVRAIVTNEESGKHVNEDDLELVKTELQHLYDSFKNELEKSKLKTVGRHISYYDILTKPVSVLETCLNRNVLENIESSEIEKELPFYGDMLRMRIRKIKERQILVEFCEKHIKTLFQLEYEPPIFITDKLISYLSSVDLITLWRVFKRQGEYLSIFFNRLEGMKLLKLNK